MVLPIAAGPLANLIPRPPSQRMTPLQRKKWKQIKADEEKERLRLAQIKPLPAPPQPYFEFMFANADHDTGDLIQPSQAVDTDPVKKASPTNINFERYEENLS